MSDEPYRDGLLYDLEYRDFDEDVAYYVELARALAAGRPVVELGCGTGRLTLPLARAGIDTIGVDRAGAMVDRLEEKLGTEPADVAARVRIVRADYRDWAPDERVPLVLWPFNAVHHLDSTDALVAMLALIRRWVRPRGVLALDGYLPDPDLYGPDPETRHERRTFRDPRTGEPIESWEQGWWDAAARTSHVVQVYRRPGGAETRVHLRLRMFTRDELHEAIRRAGWRLVAEYRDFGGEPPAPDALKWVGQLVGPD